MVQNGQPSFQVRPWTTTPHVYMYIHVYTCTYNVYNVHMYIYHMGSNEVQHFIAMCARGMYIHCTCTCTV